MDPNIKQKWIEALRSGKYQQARRALRDGDRYCCLGVLCDVAELGEWVEPQDERGVYEMRFDVPSGSTAREDMLPQSTLKEIGMQDHQQDFCWKMNDEERKSFSEIADYIEANL